MAKKETPEDARKYEASAQIPSVPLGNLGSKNSIKLDVRRRGDRLGTFEVSRTTFEWKRARKQAGIRMTWLQLAELLEK
jgi:hypothetical protein